MFDRGTRSHGETQAPPAAPCIPIPTAPQVPMHGPLPAALLEPAAGGQLGFDDQEDGCWAREQGSGGSGAGWNEGAPGGAQHSGEQGSSGSGGGGGGAQPRGQPQGRAAPARRAREAVPEESVCASSGPAGAWGRVQQAPGSPAILRAPPSPKKGPRRDQSQQQQQKPARAKAPRAGPPLGKGRGGRAAGGEVPAGLRRAVDTAPAGSQEG